MFGVRAWKARPSFLKDRKPAGKNGLMFSWIELVIELLYSNLRVFAESRCVMRLSAESEERMRKRGLLLSWSYWL